METYSTVLSEEQIATRIKDLGAQITKDYNGKEITVVCMLKGAVYFFTDLTRHIKCPMKVDFARISSYKDGTVSGSMDIVSDITTDITGKDVLIVEDVVDSGKTLSCYKDILLKRKPKSVKLCAFLDKPERREVEVKVDYVGFNMKCGFVVGYGMDYAEKYRELPILAELHFD